jgi:hypothetical protein
MKKIILTFFFIIFALNANAISLGDLKKKLEETTEQIQNELEKPKISEDSTSSNEELEKKKLEELEKKKLEESEKKKLEEKKLTKSNDSSSIISDSDENSKICKRALTKYKYYYSQGLKENVTGNFLGGQDFLEVKNKIISEKKTFVCPECKSINVNLLEVNDIYRTQNGEGRGEFEWIFAEGNLNGYVKGWTLMDNNLLVQVAEVQGGSLSNGVYDNHLIIKKFSDNSDQGMMLFCLDEKESDRGYWIVDSQGNETRHKYYQSNYQKFDLQVNKKTMEQETKKSVDKSLGGYKNFYFDMNISQIKQEVNNVCPDQKFTNIDMFQQKTKHWLVKDCLNFGGQKRELHFHPNTNDTIEKISIVNMDYVINEFKTVNYFTKNISGNAVYDKFVKAYVNKYKLIRYPTKEEIQNFNSGDTVKILKNEAQINTFFQNEEDNNIISLRMYRTNKNNHFFDIDYLSPTLSKEILNKEKGNKISNDDI